MQPALSTRNRRLFNRCPSLLWKIRKVVQKYSIIIAFLPRHHKPQLLILNRAAGHSHASETGHSIARPTACGSRVPPQRTLALGNSPPSCEKQHQKLKFCRPLKMASAERLVPVAISCAAAWRAAPAAGEAGMASVARTRCAARLASVLVTAATLSTT